MSIKTSAALLLAASCALAVSADTIVFKSGSRLEGEIVSIAGGEIKFKSDDVGTLTIKDEKVASLTTTKSKVQYKDNTVAEGALAKQNDAYTLAGKPIDMKNVKGLRIKTRAYYNGEFEVRTSLNGEVLGKIKGDGSNIWTAHECELPNITGVNALYLTYTGGGTPSLKSIEFLH